MAASRHRFRAFAAAAIVLLVSTLAPMEGDATPPDVPELYAIRTEHFVFTFHAPNRRAVEPLAAQAESIRRRVCHELDLGADPTRPCFAGPVRVHVAESAEEFYGMRPGGGAPPPSGHVDWAVGVAYADLDFILLRIDRTALLDLDDTFVHEVSHVALHEGTGGRFLPRWFLEGVAIHQAGEDVVQRLEAATQAALTGSLLPYRDIEFRFPESVARVRLAYAQSVLFLRWLLAEVEPDGHVQVVRRVAAGERFRDAFEDVFGDTPEGLHDAWSRGLRDRASWIPVVTGTGFLWGLLTFVFVWTWWRKRREMRALLDRWEEDDVGRPHAWYEPDGP